MTHLGAGIPDDFHAQFAAWLRIEPRCRSDDFERGVQARIADPLWLLARQWQTGEFQGEDAGSPIHVELAYSTQSIDRVKLGRDAASASLPHGIPLEAVVEEEPTQLSLRERVRIGQEYERRLVRTLRDAGEEAATESLIAALRAVAGFPLEREDEAMHALDRASQRFVRFMRDRVIDGAAVVVMPIPSPPDSPIGQADLDAVRDDVLTWWARVCHRPDHGEPPAWQSRQLDYHFELNAHDGLDPAERRTPLVAADYRNGALDWYTFSAGGAVQGPWQPPAEPGLNPIATTPTRVSVSGTASRWWEFEDGNTDFGALDVATPDLAKLFLMEFVLVYGDDFFSVPVPVPVGRLARIDSLTVWNTFGDEVDVGPARRTAGEPTERFDLFTLAPAGAPRDAGIGDFLVIPPLVGMRQESAPLDEVRFLRDEGANMVWGVEHVVPNGLGRPVPGFDAQRERIERERERELGRLERELGEIVAALATDLTDAERDALLQMAHEHRAEIARLAPYARPTPSQSEVPRYRLATTVPENWIPFIPVRRGAAVGRGHPRIQFHRAQMLRNSDDPEPVPSMSRLLAMREHPLLFLNEETVPRAGLRVQLTKQRARWTDGSTHVWLGRKVLTGRGEGASGLRFDVVGSDRHA